jgi:hypothetical protein
MAEKLLLYYKYMKEQAGMQGQIKLAMQTKIPSTLASTAVDSPENINKFIDAVEKLTGKPAPKL